MDIVAVVVVVDDDVVGGDGYGVADMTVDDIFHVAVVLVANYNLCFFLL